MTKFYEIVEKLEREFLLKSVEKAFEIRRKKSNAFVECLDQILLTKYSFNIDNVYVKKSNVHGLGVFTNKSISKDEILTIYPCDLLKVDGWKNVPEKFIEYGFLIPFKPGYGAYGDCDKYSSDYCGHLINDFTNDWRAYDKHSDRYNCIFRCLYGIILIVATKDINTEEELFISYGENYWRTKY